MEIDKKIEKIVKNARKRLCKIRFYKVLLMFIIIGLCVWGIFQTIALIVPFYGATVYGILACMLVIIAGVIIAIVKYPSMKDAALKLDSKGFNERITTAMELRGKKDIFSMLQKNDAIQKTESVSVRKLFPYNIKKIMFLFLFLSSMYVLTTAMIPAKTKEIAQEQHVIEQEKKTAEEELEELVSEIKQSHELSTEEIERLNEILDEAKEELKEAETSSEIDKVKERFESKMYESIGEEQPDQNKREAEAIQNALDKAQKEKISAKDKEEIAKELEDLAKKNQDEELQKTAEELQKELEQNGDFSQDTVDKAKEQLQPYTNPSPGMPSDNGLNGEDGKQQQSPNGDPKQSQGQDGQQQPGQSSQPGQDGQQQPGQNGQQPGQNGQQPGQDGQQPGQDGQQPGQDGQQPGQDGQQPGQDGQQPGQDGQQPGQDGQQPGQDGQQPGGGQQPGQDGQQPGQDGQQPGQDGQQPGSNGGKGGGDGWSHGSKVGNENKLDLNDDEIMIPENSDPNEKLSGQANQDGNSKLSKSDHSNAWSGKKGNYNQVKGEWEKKAYEKMNNSKIPGTMKDLVKGYFGNK